MLVIDLLQMLEEAKKAFDQEFIQYVYSNPGLRGLRREYGFDDLSDVEDLFDMAYLRDLDIEELCIALTKNKKIPTLAKAEREALSTAKFVIDNMSDEYRKAWKSKLTSIAQEWAKKIAPTIVAKSPDYID